MNKQQIKDLALASGFKLKPQVNGTEDLNPYVYKFAAELAAQAGREGYLQALNDSSFRIDGYYAITDVQEEAEANDYANSVLKELG